MTENKKTTINILILFYIHYGNTIRMTYEISKWAKEIPETNVAIKCIANDVSMDIISKNSSWVSKEEYVD